MWHKLATDHPMFIVGKWIPKTRFGKKTGHVETEEVPPTWLLSARRAAQRIFELVLKMHHIVFGNRL